MISKTFSNSSAETKYRLSTMIFDLIEWMKVSSIVLGDRYYKKMEKAMELLSNRVTQPDSKAYRLKKVDQLFKDQALLLVEDLP